jgi:saccharopine dehydrogenase-like NADP-dependent oxidoreductase
VPLTDKLAYKAGERDMIVLFTELVAEYPDGTEQLITSTFVDHGQPNGDSSMARTVSLPAAIAVKLILNGSMPVTGVKIPIEPGIYEPVLDELAEMGLACTDVYGERKPMGVAAR